MSAHASKGIRFVPKMPPLLGHAPSSIGLPRPSSTSSAKRPTRTRNNLLITSERLLKTRNRMIPNSAPLDSGGIRAADNGAHRRTRDRRRRNPHFVQRLRSQDVRNSTCAAASKRYSLAGDYLLSGPTTVHSACFFAIASYRAPTNITPEKTLRPFDSIDSRVRSLTRVSNVAPMRRYR
jgi:hypothetical protein